MLKHDHFLSYLIWVFSAQLFFISSFVLVFFWNFQQFIVFALREIKESLQESMWNRQKLEKCLSKLTQIENLLKYFEHNFGFQLTLTSAVYIFSNITFVSKK
jgi:hypothetical protein